MQNDSTPMTNEIPYGYCHCGCGGLAPLAKATATRYGHVKGEPVRFIHNHHGRRARGITLEDSVNFLRRIRVEPSGCWTWTASKNRDGYGSVQWGGLLRRAHRVSYALFVGAIREGYVLDHLCRNPACVNPDHLEQVTHTVNVRRGRATKLTEDDVREIRDTYKAVRNIVGLEPIAALYDVTPNMIGKIVSGGNWKDI